MHVTAHVIQPSDTQLSFWVCATQQDEKNENSEIQSNRVPFLMSVPLDEEKRKNMCVKAVLLTQTQKHKQNQKKKN